MPRAPLAIVPPLAVDLGADCSGKELNAGCHY
jgi:hypothetical protein